MPAIQGGLAMILADSAAPGLKRNHRQGCQQRRIEAIAQRDESPLD